MFKAIGVPSFKQESLQVSIPQNFPSVMLLKYNNEANHDSMNERT